MAIEAEVRSFLTKEQFDKLLTYFEKEAKRLKEDYQETFYLDCEQDLRIQRNDFFAKVWLKKGKLHDDHREEIEVKVERDQFEELEKLFVALGHQVEIKWFRKRHQFDWDNITVCLDYTRGYGYIIELEKMCEEGEQDATVKLLKEKLASLNIPLSPKEAFKEKFEHYKENWKTLTKE